MRWWGLAALVKGGLVGTDLIVKLRVGELMMVEIRIGREGANEAILEVEGHRVVGRP